MNNHWQQIKSRIEATDQETERIVHYLKKQLSMAYNVQLANRLRERLQDLPHIEEKEMMGGLVFMLNDKMCVGIIKDELMCRIDPERHETEVERRGCRTMDFTKRPMIGYVLVDETGMKTREDFEHWIELCLEFNPKAKASKKKIKK